MKRILTISALVAAFGYGAAKYPVVAQDPPKPRTTSPHVDINERNYDVFPEQDESATALEQYRKAEQDLANALAENVGLRTGAKTEPARERNVSVLRPLVEECFDARQRLQLQELEQLRRQLGEIEDALQEREKNKDVIVSSRVEELISGRIVQAVSNVPSGVSGTVSWIRQIEEPAVIEKEGLRIHRVVSREISVGDKVKAGDPLVKIITGAGVKPEGSLVEILAPIDGVIIKKNINVGNMVTANDTLFQISSAIFGNGSGGRQPTEHGEVQGIGATLVSEGVYTVVREVVAGGAADEDKRLEGGDKIIGVGQATGEIVDITGMKLSEVARLIRGEAGSKVRLQVIPKSSPQEVKVYELIRQAVELKSAEDHGEIFDVSKRSRGAGPIGDESPEETKSYASADDGAFDIDTRERLSRLDLKVAEEEYVVAEKAYVATEKELNQARKAQEEGVVTEDFVSTREEEHRLATVAVERAKIKLDGLVRRRSELAAAAQIAVSSAGVECERATAKVRFAEARVKAARSEVKQREADVAAAEASYKVSEKRFERMYELAEQKSVETRLVDEADANRKAAKATLASAKAAFETSQANIEQSEAELALARAELSLAKQRLQTAQGVFERFESTSSNQSKFWIDPVSHNEYWVSNQYRVGDQAAAQAGENATAEPTANADEQELANKSVPEPAAQETKRNPSVPVDPETKP